MLACEDDVYGETYSASMVDTHRARATACVAEYLPVLTITAEKANATG
ncbi:hypothetical protein [Enterovibrio baiacu]|nr:hypothetical protein [Enterovibrio baiacu]